MIINIVATIGILIGIVWFLQGINVLPGSFMTGRIEWSFYGSLLVLASVAALIGANRRRPPNGVTHDS